MVKLNADCARKQVEIAKKRNSYAEYIGDNDDCNAEKHAYNVGDVVRAKRGGTVRHKDPYAEGVWTARGVVVSIASVARFVRLRWITMGLSGERPGSLSRRWFYEARLLMDPNRKEGHATLKRYVKQFRMVGNNS